MSRVKVDVQLNSEFLDRFLKESEVVKEILNDNAAKVESYVSEATANSQKRYEDAIKTKIQRARDRKAGRRQRKPKNVDKSEWAKYKAEERKRLSDKVQNSTSLGVSGVEEQGTPYMKNAEKKHDRLRAEVGIENPTFYDYKFASLQRAVEKAGGKKKRQKKESKK